MVIETANHTCKLIQSYHANSRPIRLGWGTDDWNRNKELRRWTAYIGNNVRVRWEGVFKEGHRGLVQVAHEHFDRLVGHRNTARARQRIQVPETHNQVPTKLQIRPCYFYQNDTYTSYKINRELRNCQRYWFHSLFLRKIIMLEKESWK